MLCSELSLRKTIPPAAVGIAHHSILNQGFSIRNILESTKARVIPAIMIFKVQRMLSTVTVVNNFTVCDS